MLHPRLRVLAVLIMLALVTPVAAAVQLPTCFSDHMVLQAGRPLPVWGKADPQERITVTIGGQTRTVVAAADGRWRVDLDAMRPGDPLTLTVQGAGPKARVVTDVLVGEVWLCSGQSNMALTVSRAQDFAQEKSAANWPGIRMMINGRWKVCSPETVGGFSAAGYFFGRELHRTLHVPIGLLNVSSGGTPIGLWTSLAAQRAVPELAPVLAASGSSAAASQEDAEQARSDQRQAVEVEGAQAVAAAKTSPGMLFDARIVPLAPFAIQGVAWYQGEADSYTTHANLYGVQLATMISDWRRLWGYDFTFLTVQLPDFGPPQTEPVQTHGRVLVREGELQSLRLPNTGLAVTIGIGDRESNHPRNKQEVGRRLAQWALASVYGRQDVAASGPVPERSRVDGGRIVITFSHADGGLVAHGGGELHGFAIAGADMRWVWGTATITGDSVAVASPDVPAPVAVRYAWAVNPADSNLWNGAGLPATPFRTDAGPLANAARR